MTDSNYGPHTQAWRELEKCAEAISGTTIADLFASNPMRFERFSLEDQGLLLDFSRQRLDEAALEALIRLAEQTEVPAWIERMYSGFPVNNTEDRPALHIALRRPADQPVLVDGENVMPAVEAERKKMRQMADALHAGDLRGWTGKPIADVVNIGIGGSDLGIVMATRALAEHSAPGIGVHCVSNIDGVALSHVLARVDPETTLFVICSKTFTTLETITNARAARAWLVEHCGEAAVTSQCVAVSTNLTAMDEFGIAPDKRFTIWEWVGGRYSLWSAVGLTIALAIGSGNFDALLRGAHAMDEHFETALLEQNLPVLLALIGIWNRNFLDVPTHCVLPYDDHLARLPAYLQQLEMESNGKSVRRNGLPVECVTCPVIWGEPGSNAQHSFFQLLHQGVDAVSLDFLLPGRSLLNGQQQELAAANCFAQSWALATGDPSPDRLGGHQYYPGGRPNSLLMFEQLCPETLGRLVALYEHKVFVQGVVWDVNSFDQWGVQLGKRLASIIADSDSDDYFAAPVIAGALRTYRRMKS